MIVTGQSKEILKQARELISDPRNDPKILKSSILALESYQNNKHNSISLRTDAEQELYTKYIMAFNLFDFEVNDFIKGVYCLIRSNFLISENIIRKLSKHIRINQRFIADDSWFMLLNILTCYKQDFDFLTVSQIFIKLQSINPPSSDWCVQALFDLCCVGQYSISIWRRLLSFDIVKDAKYLDKLRVIKYSAMAEGMATLDNVIFIGIDLMLEDCIKLASEQKNLSKKMDLGMLALNKMQREVDFVLKKLVKYDLNVNIDNVYVVDFYNREENFGFDLSGALHYFTHDVTERQEALDDSCLVPALRMKSLLLKKQGYRVGRISFYEWNRYVDQNEKLIFLKRKLRLLKRL